MSKSYSDIETEKRLKRLEKEIAGVYQQAFMEMQAKANDYFDKLDKQRIREEYLAYKEGKYTKAEFDAWYRTQVERGQGYDKMADQLAERISGANIVASSYINDTTPSIFSLNQMFEAYTISNGSEYQFANWHIYNEQAVRNLLMDDVNVLQFKTTSVNPKRDYEWNQKQIRRATASAIIQGKSIDELADSYYSVMKRNRASAMRNARTSITSAQNAGRLDAFMRAAEMGIDVRKEWMCTHDARTRDSHADLDGEKVPYDKPFSNGLMFPADADGAPAEVYNCRCTMVVNLPDFDRDEERMTYGDWIKQQEQMNTVPKNEKQSKKMLANSRAVRRWNDRHDTQPREIRAGGTNSGNGSVRDWYGDLISTLEAYNTNFIEPQKQTQYLTSKRIIKKISSFDKTENGACYSQALAYVANRAGYDVTDYRKDTYDIFASVQACKEMLAYKGVISKTVMSKNDIKATEEILKDIIPHKEYLLITGKHGAIVFKEDDVIKYIELQGFIGTTKELTDRRLVRRFRCNSERTDETSTILIDVNSLSKSEDFQKIIGYFNSKKG